MQNDTGKNFSVAALVCGILGIVLSFIPYVSYVSIILAILGIVFGVKGRQTSPESKGMATAGLVLGIIGVCLWGLVILCAFCAAGVLLAMA